jgi:hypothetical protein
MAKSVAAKMGIKEGTRAIFIHAQPGDLNSIRPPDLNIASSFRGQFDYIHFFVTSQAALDKKLPALKKHLKPTGMVWISWPKGKQNDTDLTLTVVIKIGYDHGLVESKTLSINSTWSAIKFTYPKKGKVYNNSFGKLKNT